MLLMELTHATGPGEIDISTEQQTARSNLPMQIVSTEQQHSRSADGGIATLLDELERVLLQVGHQPSSITARRDLKEIQDSIQSQGILF